MGKEELPNQHHMALHVEDFFDRAAVFHEKIEGEGYTLCQVEDESMTGKPQTYCCVFFEGGGFQIPMHTKVASDKLEIMCVWSKITKAHEKGHIKKWVHDVWNREGAYAKSK